MPAHDVDHLAHLRADSARLREVLARMLPDTRIPSCPDWTTADLLYHLAEVQTFWGTVVRDRLTDLSGYVDPPRPASYADLLTLHAAGADLLCRSLEATPDDVEVWTWFASDQSVGFVRRRQAHEAVIHRVDAELAAGEPVSIDAALATDGVAEVVDWMFSGVPPWAEHTVDGAVGRVTTTDSGAQWLVRLGRWSGTSPTSGTTYVDERSLTVVGSGEPTFGVSGTASDLDLWLWNRPAGEVTLTGDSAAFEALIRSGVQ